MVPHLIVVTGPPAAGKTTLGRRLVADLGLPFLYKDGIKERLHESLGGATVEESMALGRASFDVLFHVAGAMLAAGQSLVLEANFGPSSVDGFERLRESCPFTPLQIYCTAPADIILQRYRERAERGERHPAHMDSERVEQLEEQLSENVHRPLSLGGPVLTAATSEADVLSYSSMLAAVRRHLGYAGA